MAIYKFTHRQDEWIQTNLNRKNFENRWIKIENNGKITLKGAQEQGYSWDGCSPKWKILGKIIGTPDGRIDPKTNKPKTYYASMFHDAIYQYKNTQAMKISRKEADLIFLIMLKKAKFRFWRVYYLGVRIGGGFYGKWRTTSSQLPIEVSEYSWISD
ncbi:MAG: hypothetical protein ABF273_05485 [Wenyingzhuangia sp.]|uniref:DUF1353 domain-containing protein n=1 Tax=Wenyingzhuangia sp. TaxID=1964193 RepID=UPI003219F725